MSRIEDLVELNTLNECTYECTKQSRWKEVTQRYIANMLINNLILRNDILHNTYSVLPTNNFYINERGHIRYIEAPAIRDRIIQKVLTKQVLMPALRPCLIYDNYASLKNRGTSFARKRLDVMLRKYIYNHGTNGYILLIDIKKYFESIDHDVLKSILVSRLQYEPQEIINFIFYIIDHSSHTNKGLNLGSEAPQILAIYYLGVMDTFIKIVKRQKYYGRYMDDAFVICQSKQELQQLLVEIKRLLRGLKLEINNKKTHIVKLSHGFTFLQIKYNILSSGKILKRPSHNKLTREKRRLKAFYRKMKAGQLTEDAIRNCYKSWRGTVVKDHNAYYRSLQNIDALYKKLFPQRIDKPGNSRKELFNIAFREIDIQDIQFIV